jgi:hypothetical protein
MANQEKKPGGVNNRKKKFYRRFAKGAAASRGTYKSKVQGLENNEPRNVLQVIKKHQKLHPG